MSAASPYRSRARAQQGQAQAARAAWLIACDLAAQACDADVRVVVKTRGTPGKGGTAQVSRARKLACYLALVVANVDPTRLAVAAGLDRKTINEHASWVEDRREDPANPDFERLVAGLEEALVRMATRIVLAHLGDAEALEAA